MKPKSCIFCGYTPDVCNKTIVEGENTHTYTVYWVCCNNEKCSVNVRSLLYRSEQLSIESWNKAMESFCSVKMVKERKKDEKISK